MRSQIVAVGAICSAGGDWPSTWRALLAGHCGGVPVPSRYHPFHGARAAIIEGVDRTRPTATASIARGVLAQLCGDDSSPVLFYGGTNHGESDLLLEAHTTDFGPQEAWTGLLTDSVPESCDAGEGCWTYSACTSGMHALLAACLDITEESPDAIVLASDGLSAVALAGFWQARAASRSTCAPFHQHRDGMLVGEGAAGIRVRAADARSRGKIGVLGMGMSCDAFHPTDPDPSGQWLRTAIDDALGRAGIDPSSISGVVAHGTATLKNDAVEAAVYRGLWPELSVPVTSIKGTIGHTMGAAGLFNVLVAAQARLDGVLPPTVGNGSAPIEEIDLVVERPRRLESSGPLLALASGFGGNNVACVVGVLP